MLDDEHHWILGSKQLFQFSQFWNLKRKNSQKQFRGNVFLRLKCLDFENDPTPGMNQHPAMRRVNEVGGIA
jgi:hypothetical protein